MSDDLWQQDDDTIAIFLDLAARRLIESGVIPMTDDVQDLPRYEQTINELAENLFIDEEQ